MKSKDDFISDDEEEDKEEFITTFNEKRRSQDEQNILSDLIDENKETMIGIVLNKFNNRKGVNGNSSFFVQQIHVQPPDGLNATVAAPLTPGGGWAPSIPHTNPNLSKTSLKDLTIRAKAGVQSGDVQKEAHMAYNLAVLNEEKKNLKKAIRFYKRFFFCARLLEDPVGAALALNRIGVAYHKLKKFEKSLNFHKKHLEFSDTENIYAAYYNCGISLRFMKQYSESIEYFNKSLDWSRKRKDYASECLSCGQLGLAYFLNKENEQALAFFQTCLKISKSLKNFRLQLDCLLCIGYTIRTMLENEKLKPIGKQSKPEQSWEIVMDAFEQAYNIAKGLEENEMAEEILCNMGIARGNLALSTHHNDYFSKYMEHVQMTMKANDYDDEDEEDAIDGNEDEIEKQESAESIEEDGEVEELEVGESFV